MGTRRYRFGRFLLNPQARELFDGDERVNLPVSTIDSLIYLIEHRDRPVGRDELAAAVWGRADISEVSLSHAIMRLRKRLGDTGSEQRAIRTVPRLGYRWVMEDTIEEDPDATAGTPFAIGGTHADERSASIPAHSVSAATLPASTRSAPMPPDPMPARRRTSLAPLALVVVAIVVAATAVVVLRRDDARIPAAGVDARSAMVLPAAIDATPDAGWLRLGLMDFVASRLRHGGVATAPSESVVALTHARDAAKRAFDASAFPDAMIVQPAATSTRGAWRVRLDARRGGRDLRVETSAPDPIAAGRAAADELLIKLGRVPPAEDESGSPGAEATLRQHVNAAVLSGQLDVARDLIRNAPDALRQTPEIAFSEAKIDFFAGRYADSRAKIETLLARLPEDAAAALRGRALNTLGAAYFREGRLDDAARAYGESIRLVEHAEAPGVLANAYIGSGGVASQRLRLDEAADDYGRARTLLDLGDDAFGVAAVDLNLGMIALQRGQPAAALPTLRGAAARFDPFANEDALAAALAAIVDADLALLDTADALATADRFATLQSRGGAGRERWELVLARARALAGAGKLGDADALLARIADASDPAQDAVTRAQGNVLGAEVALARGDCAHAAEIAEAAMTPTLDGAIPVDYARAARLRVEALACAGDPAAAGEALTAFQAWAAHAPAAALGIEMLRARAWAARTPEDARAAWTAAMSAATARAIPDEVIGVGLACVRSLIAAGRLDEAVSINGRTAAWAGRDARAALIQALVYAALGRSAEAGEAFQRARKLAGERVFADLPPPRNRTAGR
ncbi:MAG TPA: winged helix-turn-helix domain-containing protein [Rhodanobacteraceae bacterium]|nr:winged helix-turn-helix domain-containing protein [Rhodanobacteraceae bacterium]